MPLIIGLPFLSTARAHIDVGVGEIHFNINGKEEKFPFWPKKEQCSMIKIKYGPNPQGIKEVKVTPPVQTPPTTTTKKTKKVWRKVESACSPTPPGRDDKW